MSLFRQEVIEARRRRLWGEVRLSQPPSLLIWTGVACISGVLVILVLIFGTYVRKETVHGYLSPDGGIIQVFAPRTGRISAILVQEGQHVSEGDLLIVFSGETVGLQTGQVLKAQISEVDQQIEDEEEKRSIRHMQQSAELKRVQEHLAHQESLKDILAKRVAEQTQSISISDSQLVKLRKLSESGYASQLQIDQMSQQILSQRAGLSNIQEEINSVDANISDDRLQMLELPSKVKEDISTAQAGLSQLRQKKIDLLAEQSFAERSPVGGVVSNVQAETGQMAGSNLPLISIMPDGANLQADILIPTRAAAMIKSGDEVRLSIEAYPYQKFGFIEGRVASISKSVLLPGTFLAPIDFKEAVYRVRVNLNRDFVVAYGQKKRLRSGMLLTADIVTDRLPLWREAFDPLLAASKRLN